MFANLMKLISIFLISTIIFSKNTYSQDLGSATGLKLPRFVFTKSNEINLRVGASTDYPIRLTYTAKNFPLEIVDEYENWRQVVDYNGNEGWVLGALLRGNKKNRYGIVKILNENYAKIYNKPNGKNIGKIGNKNIVRLNKCFSNWCHISIKKYRGWTMKKNIWGVYKDEKFNMPFYQFIIEIYWKII